MPWHSFHIGVVTRDKGYFLSSVRTFQIRMPIHLVEADPVAQLIGELTLNPLYFSPLWFEPRSGDMRETQVLLTEGQVVFPRVLRFTLTFDEGSARYT